MYPHFVLVLIPLYQNAKSKLPHGGEGFRGSEKWSEDLTALDLKQVRNI